MNQHEATTGQGHATARSYVKGAHLSSDRSGARPRFSVIVTLRNGKTFSARTAGELATALAALDAYTDELAVYRNRGG